MGNGVTDPSYDPSLEWPGDDENTELDNSLISPTSGQPAHSSPTFRLTVQATSILPKAQRLAVIEGYAEVQIGRDVAPQGSVVPRIRLKEMEVSKLHATIYWDDGRAEWGLVDMGSKHGTFHNRYHSGISSSRAGGSRLSPPRIASMPRCLQHLDTFSIGSTTFVVHIHDDGLPCTECSRSDNEIPLFITKTSTPPTHGKRKRDEERSYVPSDKDPKKALSLLKKSLLSQRPGEKPGSNTTTTWVDRSARRRAMNPPSPPLSRKQSPLPSSGSVHSIPHETPTASRSSTPEPVSSNNIGYRMLEKQGWSPGTSLGIPGDGAQHLVEPIELPSTSNRAGLGSAGGEPHPLEGTNWREDGKHRLWSRLNP